MSDTTVSRTMPPEWAPHTATWMGFPRGAYPGAAVTDDDAQRAWAHIANTIAEFEPVNMLCHAEDLGVAGQLLGEGVTQHLLDIDDAWLRDTGPTFVIEDSDEGKALIAVDWQFNGWGQNTAFDWQLDALVGRAISELTGVRHESSELVNEGGAIHVNGLGHVMMTQTVQLDEHRNPSWHRDQVDQEIHQRLGTEHSIWLPRGLHRDYLEHGTRGHVDMIACFIPDGRVLLHQQRDHNHPDWQLYTPLKTLIEQHGFKVVALPAPQVTRDSTDWVDYSYVNHYVLNGAVICPTFADPNDALAQDILQACYPGREVIGVDARALFALGGGVHCITQQQPALPGNESDTEPYTE